jgi:hypothetical protein
VRGTINGSTTRKDIASSGPMRVRMYSSTIQESWASLWAARSRNSVSPKLRQPIGRCATRESQRVGVLWSIQTATIPRSRCRLQRKLWHLGWWPHAHSYVFVRPQISLPAKVSPFAQVLVGVAEESAGRARNAAFFSLGSDNSLATAVGVGIDVKSIPLLSVRLIQIDYLRTQLHGATQNQPCISAGVVFHF